MSTYAFRRVTRDDFPLLAHWLTQPHVHRWWFHESSPEAVERDFGPGVDGREPGEDLIALRDGDPLGLVQRARWGDYPEDLEEIAPVLAVPPDAVELDYLIGELGDTGRGLGPAVIRAAVADTWTVYPAAPCIVVPVVAANRPSWRALEHAGFHRVAEGDLEPENPVDDPWHVVYRLDRPPT